MYFMKSGFLLHFREKRSIDYFLLYLDHLIV